MRDEVYEFLLDYGFTNEEVEYFQDDNEKMFFTDLDEVNKNISFLTSKGLGKEEVMYVFRNDSFAITVKDNRLVALDEVYYGVLSLSSEELKTLIMNNPECYTQSPIEMKKIIDHLVSKGHTINEIKEYFLKNSKVINLTLEEFINSISEIN